MSMIVAAAVAALIIVEGVTPAVADSRRDPDRVAHLVADVAPPAW